MMSTLFISDLHLSEDRPHLTYLFDKFLERYAVHAESLYILGDFFDMWIGDDDLTDYNQSIIHKLKIFSKNHKIPVYLMRGNRDFLIGRKFFKKSSSCRLVDPSLINLYGENILLMHGDTLCTDDHAYLKFRKKARNWWMQRLFLLKSLAQRRAIALRAKALSKEHKSKVNAKVMDATPSEIPRLLKQYNASTFIHGHTHRPSLHTLKVDGETCQRIVLADWEKQGNYLVVYPNGLKRLCYFS